MTTISSIMRRMMKPATAVTMKTQRGRELSSLSGREEGGGRREEGGGGGGGGGGGRRGEGGGRREGGREGEGGEVHSFDHAIILSHVQVVLSS